MDPQLKSVVGSVALWAASSIAAWAASKGLIPSGDQTTIANDLVFAGATFAAGALAWYKKWQSSHPQMVASLLKTKAGQNAMVNAINGANNLVKVVPDTQATANVPAVNEVGKVGP